MKSFIRALVILASACTLGIAAQGEAKSKSKEGNEPKVKSERHEKKLERKERKRKEKCEKKCGYLKKCEERKQNDFVPFPIDEIPKVEPVIELPVIEQPTPIGERNIK